MILTVTLNVAIDKRYVVEEFRFGEVLRVSECNYTAGGKGLNVSKIARLLGEEVTATGFAGGHAGAYVKEQLAGAGIAEAFTDVPGETRSCVNLLDKATGVTTEFLEPGFPVSPEKAEQFLADFAGLLAARPVVCISGSAPKGIPPAYYARIIEAARAKGCFVLLDASGENLRAGIGARPDLIKPNRDELRALLGREIGGRDEVVAAARELHARGIGAVVVSLGKEGAVAVCDEGVFLGITPDVPVVNTVGCGDSMIGAFAVGTARGLPMAEGLALATAVSTANALCMETGHFRPEDLARLEREVRVEQLA